MMHHTLHLFFFSEVVYLCPTFPIVSYRDFESMSFIENSLEDIKFKFSTAYHPQTDAQAKVVNKSLGNLL